MDAVAPILEMAKQAGPFAAFIMGFLWWQERAERREIQERHDKVVTEAIEAMIETKAALSAMSAMMGARK